MGNAIARRTSESSRSLTPKELRAVEVHAAKGLLTGRRSLIVAFALAGGDAAEIATVTKDDVDLGTRRLRPIPENDPDLAALYGLREDTESMHHHLKQRMWNDCARWIGLQRQTINHHAHQTRTGFNAISLSGNCWKGAPATATRTQTPLASPTRRVPCHEHFAPRYAPSPLP